MHCLRSRVVLLKRVFRHRHVITKHGIGFFQQENQCMFQAHVPMEEIQQDILRKVLYVVM